MNSTFNYQLIFPMAAHLVFCVLLYAALTLARLPAVWGLGRDVDGNNPWATYEKRISANLSNQFEWPLFFHLAAVIFLTRTDVLAHYAVIAAWMFIVGRVLHSAVQIGTANVRLRGLVFMLNFVAVLVMWGELLMQFSAIKN